MLPNKLERPLSRLLAAARQLPFKGIQEIDGVFMDCTRLVGSDWSISGGNDSYLFGPPVVHGGTLTLSSGVLGWERRGRGLTVEATLAIFGGFMEDGPALYSNNTGVRFGFRSQDERGKGS